MARVAAIPPLLKDLNERTVLDAIRAGAPISRAEISRRAGISKPTVSLALQSLLDAGLVRETEPDPGQPTYGATFFEVVPEAGLVLGLDVGARFLRGAICDLRGEIRARQDIELDGADAERALEAIAALRVSLADASGLPADRIDCAVVGVPGVVDADTGRLTLATNVPGLEGRDWAGELNARMELTVSVENDTNLAAVGERWRGMARGVEDFVFLSVGTGLGAGLVLRGELHRGRHGAAGEVDLVAAGRDEDIDPCATAVSALAAKLVGANGARRRCGRHTTRGRSSPRPVAATRSRGRSSRRRPAGSRSTSPRSRLSPTSPSSSSVAGSASTQTCCSTRFGISSPAGYRIPRGWRCRASATPPCSPGRWPSASALLSTTCSRTAAQFRLGGSGGLSAVPPGRAARPEASSVSRADSNRYRRSLRPSLGTSTAPRRRATLRQTLPSLGAGLGPEVDAAVRRVAVDLGELLLGEVEPVERRQVRLELLDAVAPISVEVTRGSRRVQASAICARDWPRPRGDLVQRPNLRKRVVGELVSASSVPVAARAGVRPGCRRGSGR